MKFYNSKEELREKFTADTSSDQSAVEVMAGVLGSSIGTGCLAIRQGIHDIIGMVEHDSFPSPEHKEFTQRVCAGLPRTPARHRTGADRCPCRASLAGQHLRMQALSQSGRRSCKAG
jgi:hypothetical protein